MDNCARVLASPTTKENIKQYPGLLDRGNRVHEQRFLKIFRPENACNMLLKFTTHYTGITIYTKKS
jgi:hypothetical protein